MKLHAVDAAVGLRAVLYLRQSTHREESISLELQEHEGRAYAERRGYEVVAVESDPGISGRTWKRPAVQRVMEMVDASAVDVIVLWKWSRLSRSRLDWAVAADRVQTAGGRIESATEPLDTTTSTGRLARGMLTEFAAFESERIGDVWKETHARRVRRGMPANGKPRFGYTYSSAEGFTVDPLTGPVLAETFRRYIAGESVYSIVKWLNEGPTRPVGGYGVKGDGLWSDRTIRRVMDSGFAAGFITYKGERSPGIHPPLITEEQWDAYQEARGRRRTYRRAERSEYLLSGLVRCECGSPMTAGQFGAQHTAKYRCAAAHQKRTHAGGYVTASLVEAAVFDWLVKENARQMQEAIDSQNSAAPRRLIDPTTSLTAKLESLDAKIDQLGVRAIETDMPTESYNRILAGFTRDKKALTDALLEVKVQSRAVLSIELPDLIANWGRIPIPRRREILRKLIDYVEVHPGRPRARIEVFPR